MDLVSLQEEMVGFEARVDKIKRFIFQTCSKEKPIGGSGILVGCVRLSLLFSFHLELWSFCIPLLPDVSIRCHIADVLQQHCL
ncbi:hypothetical protein I7I50_01350 [Histoplasma capsulatum G186AR]|uniref:Uncharacterized protein n=1 Tax=Ajellomyces capsulatus TaxID=5037 RepID=A0A8H7YCR0_AJECA|nr:hypothetical protein I7I52_12466 [Histoplasma capsulatum]QSS73249.1 hypothetical protein I7I50_01350 [Histoplasma capsulatum G186AR]